MNPIPIDVPQAEIAAFCQRHHIHRLAPFGSILRDDFRADSDVGVLVEFDAGHVPGFAFFGLQDELSQIFRHQVDLHTPGFLSGRFRDQVMAEAQVQYVGG